MIKDTKDSPQTKHKQQNQTERRSNSLSDSSSSKSKRSSSSGDRPKKHTDQQDNIGRLYISNLDANQSPDVLQKQIRQLIGKKYQLLTVQVKKSRIGHHFAFVDIREKDKVEEIIAQFDNYKLNGTKIVVEEKRVFGERPAPRTGVCYSCGQIGHFARDCTSKRSRTEEKHKKSGRRRKRESSSQSEQRGRNKSKKRKYRSRDKKKKDASDSSSNSSSSSQSGSSSSSSESEKRRRRAKKRKQKNKKKHAKRKGKGKSKAKKESSSESQ